MNTTTYKEKMVYNLNLQEDDIVTLLVALDKNINICNENLENSNIEDTKRFWRERIEKYNNVRYKLKEAYHKNDIE